jgi:hypothetical protein
LKLLQTLRPAVHGASDLAGPDGLAFLRLGTEVVRAQVLSHRFDPLTGPLDVTGICVDSKRILTGLSQYPVFKVQAQRGDTLRVPVPAVNRFSQPISRTSRCSLEGIQKAPAVSAGGVGRAPTSMTGSSTSIRSPSQHSELSNRAPFPNSG